MAHYSSQIYWDRRYSTHRGATFDWYLPYKSAQTPPATTFSSRGKGGGSSATAGADILREELVSTIRRGSRILVVGCGTSCLAEGLYDDGYTNLVAIDFSPACIEVMAERSGASQTAIHEDTPASSVNGGGGGPGGVLPREPLPASDITQRPGLVYAVANATELPAMFQAASFDVVLDKGMLDTCFCGDSDVQQRKYAGLIIKNIHLILRPKTGKLIHISHSNKTQGMRSVLFADDVTPWSDVTVTELVSNPIGKGGTSDEQRGSGTAAAAAGSELLIRSHYMYVLTKEAVVEPATQKPEEQ